MRRTAWRLGVSRWRSATAVFRAYGRRGVDPDVPGPTEDHAALVAALRRINADQRRAIVLHHLCDLSVEEVAAETGAPTGTVRLGSRATCGTHDLLGPDSPVAASTDDTNDGEASRHG